MANAHPGLEHLRLRVVAVAPATPRARLLTLEAAPGHSVEGVGRVPGRVAILSPVTGGPQSFVAIASPPNSDGAIEFLVKRDGAGDWLANLEVGDGVDMAGPLGDGFPVDEFEGKDLLFVAIGTAIAPVRAAIRAVLARRERYGRVGVVYGARAPEDFAFAGEFDAWRSGDVKLDLTVTRPDAVWAGATGRVHELLRDAALHALDPVAFVCGSPEMMDECEETLAGLGLARERVLRNY